MQSGAELLVRQAPGGQQLVSDAAYFRQLAERCFKYARESIDLAAAQRLRHLGEEFEKEAAKRESKKSPFDTIIWRKRFDDRKVKL